MDNSFLKKLVNLLAKHNLTLATCESLTGGLFSKLLTDIAGIGRVFKGSLVVYSKEAKIELAQVSRSTLEKYGAISEKCAQEMAQNTQRSLGVDLAISFTGNAGPTAQETKPVGLVFIGLAFKEKLIVRSYQLSGSREEIRRQVVEEGAELIRMILEEEKKFYNC